MMAMTVTPATREQAGPHRLPSAGAVLLTQIRYQLRLLLHTPRAVVAGIVLPALLLIVSHTEHGSIPASALAGLAVLGVTITAWSTNGISLVTAREAGVLKRWRATPMPPWCYFVARLVASVVLATLSGGVTMALGVLLYHVHMTGPIALGVLISVALGALAWSAAALAVTGLIPNVASAWPMLMLVYLPVVLISGVFGGFSNEPHWLTSLARYLPAQPVIDGATRALRYSAGQALFSGHDIVVLACWMVGGLIAARFLFRWQPTRRSSSRPARAAR
jgi:ABC-2 type transport system permease protein